MIFWQKKFSLVFQKNWIPKKKIGKKIGRNVFCRNVTFAVNLAKTILAKMSLWPKYLWLKNFVPKVFVPNVSSQKYNSRIVFVPKVKQPKNPIRIKEDSSNCSYGYSWCVKTMETGFFSRIKKELINVYSFFFEGRCKHPYLLLIIYYAPARVSSCCLLWICSYKDQTPTCLTAPCGSRQIDFEIFVSSFFEQVSFDLSLWSWSVHGAWFDWWRI